MESERPANTYLVCGVTPWARRVFDEIIRHYPGCWEYISRPSYLHPALLNVVQPRYIFFLHWPNRVPDAILEKCECVGFHMAPLPYGRGGSPLQNMILHGKRETRVTAFRMSPELDAGPIYCDAHMSLEGLAEEIYIRAANISAIAIHWIITSEPRPCAQQPNYRADPFKRRTPAQSEIPERDDLLSLFNFIRMLDAEGYPQAFLHHRGYRYEFSRPALRDGRIVADVTIKTEEG